MKLYRTPNAFLRLIPRQAARLAYDAQLHAAQALIFERTSKSAKTHKGVSTQFHQLAISEPAIDPKLPRDLPTAYHFKEAADYETGSAAMISATDARDAIATAEHFTAVIRRVLAPTSASAP